MFNELEEERIGLIEGSGRVICGAAPANRGGATRQERGENMIAEKIEDLEETAPIIPHRIGGARLGRTPLHIEKSKTLEPAANRYSRHPSHTIRKAVRSV